MQELCIKYEHQDMLDDFCGQFGVGDWVVQIFLKLMSEILDFQFIHINFSKESLPAIATYNELAQDFLLVQALFLIHLFFIGEYRILN